MPCSIATPTAFNTIAQGKHERAERVPAPPWVKHANNVARRSPPSSKSFTVGTTVPRCRMDSQHLCSTPSRNSEFQKFSPRKTRNTRTYVNQLSTPLFSQRRMLSPQTISCFLRPAAWRTVGDVGASEHKFSCVTIDQMHHSVSNLNGHGQAASESTESTFETSVPRSQR